MAAELITAMLQTGTESRLTADCNPIAWDCGTGVTVTQIRAKAQRCSP